MLNKPDNWDAVAGIPHFFQWRYTIDGVEYTEADIMSPGVIKRPLMDEPCIGRCCTGSLTLSVFDKVGHTIPKAATVVAECRMVSKDGSQVTGWLEQGHYWITKRSRSNDVTDLTCRDAMIFAGRTYIDKTAFVEWPVSMPTVVDEIAGFMGVQVDSRSDILSGSIYRASYPNEDTLMSQVLANIAAAHGGHFIMTPENKLRLVKFPRGGNLIQKQNIGGEYVGYTPYSTGLQKISRITLTDDADNQFTVGDDSGIELAVECLYATQAMTDNIGYQLIGGQFLPYEMQGARIDPCLELADSFGAIYRGETQNLLISDMTLYCTAYPTMDVSNRMQEDDEEEIPFVSMQELKEKRFITTNQSYHGNRINRKEGFVSEYMENDVPVARLIANSDQIAMQRKNESGAWEDVLYFDTVKRTYKFVGEVSVDAARNANKTFCQEAAPAGELKEGDLWIDSDDNYKLYRYDGAEWVSVQDLNIPDIIGQIAAANTSLNVLSTGIDAKVDTTYLTDQLDGLVKTFNSALNLKANELTLSFTGTARDMVDEVNEMFGSLIRASSDGVEIGKMGSNFRVLITNTEMGFFNGTSKVAYMSNQKMFITAAQVTSSLEIGQDGGNTFSWVKTDRGLSLSYVSADL